MDQQATQGVIELTADEACSVTGGFAYMPAMVLGAFGAGFRFGYYELGPRLFG